MYPFIFSSWDKFSTSCPGWPGTSYVVWIDLDSELLASVSCSAAPPGLAQVSFPLCKCVQVPMSSSAVLTTDGIEGWLVFHRPQSLAVVCLSSTHHSFPSFLIVTLTLFFILSLVAHHCLPRVEGRRQARPSGSCVIRCLHHGEKDRLSQRKSTFLPIRRCQRLSQHICEWFTAWKSY